MTKTLLVLLLGVATIFVGGSGGGVGRNTPEEEIPTVITPDPEPAPAPLPLVFVEQQSVAPQAIQEGMETFFESEAGVKVIQTIADKATEKMKKVVRGATKQLSTKEDVSHLQRELGEKLVRIDERQVRFEGVIDERDKRREDERKELLEHFQHSIAEALQPAQKAPEPESLSQKTKPAKIRCSLNCEHETFWNDQEFDREGNQVIHPGFQGKEGSWHYHACRDAHSKPMCEVVRFLK